MSDPSEPTDGTASGDDPGAGLPSDDTSAGDGSPADGTPGWYLDRDDPALARWHDGDEWTEHTLVIADQPAGSDPPPPPSIRRPSHAAILRERAAAEAQRKANRGDGLPKWAPVAIAVVVGLIAAGLFTFLKGDDNKATTVDTNPVSIGEAVDAARTAGFPSTIGDSRASGLIEDLCEAADRPARTATLSADLARLSLTPTQLSRTIGALGEGAKRYCPQERAGIISTVAQLQAQASGTTTSTFPTLDGGVVDGSVTTLPGDAPVTTAKSTASTTKSTATTAKPGPTTTTVPPTTTTTVPKLSVGQIGKACSPEGARAQFAGTPYSCHKVCPSDSPTWAKESAPCLTSTTQGIN